jgi:hypothetical protein
MLLALLVMGWVLMPRSPAGAAGNPSASGYIDLPEDTVHFDEYSFAAIQHQDGTVTGQAEILLQPENERIHVAIDCMTIVGNTANISGIITHPGGVFTEGSRVMFTVKDNGEGANSPPDEGSSIITEGTCPPPQFATGPSERGNVQVQP